MRTVKAVGVVVLIQLFWLGSVLASGPATTSGVILKFNNSPRAEGMGEAQTALSNDQPSAVGWNPAGLFNAYQQDISAMYFRGLVDDAFGSVNYSQTLGKDISLGGSLVIYDAGLFDLVTLDGQSSVVRAQQDILCTATGAYKWRAWDREILLGANLKLIHSTLLGSDSAMAAAIDLGGIYELREVIDDLHVGLTLKNLGTPLTYLDHPNPLPLRVTLGAAYQPIKNDKHDLTLAGDIHLDLDEEIQANLGVEYWLEKVVALRMGYKLGYDLDSLTFGLGIHYMGLQLDYAFGLMGALNSTHKVSLSYTLAVDEVRKKEVLVKKPKPTPVPTPNPTPQPTPQVQASPTPIPSVLAIVVQKIADEGGQMRQVVLSIGADKKVKPGYVGVLYGSGSIVARFKVNNVFPSRCVAQITESSGEIEMNAKAEIQLKKPE